MPTNTNTAASSAASNAAGGGNGSGAADAGSASQPTRVDKACVRCRRKKMSCRMSAENPSKCQRCLRSNEDCVFPETTERPRKRRLLNSRVGQLEQNLEGIISLLASAQAATGGAPLPFAAPSKKSTAATSSAAAKAAPATKVEAVTSPSQQPVFSENGRPDPIDKGLVTLEQAEMMLDKYKDMSANYPFVLLSDKLSLTELRDRSPMVLRAIFCATSFSDSGEQDPFEREYLHSISMHAMVEGHRSLDALQSLMIFLSWCHWHIKPERQHLYRLASLAVGICYDLGINRRPQKSEVQLVGIDVPWVKSTGLEASSADFWGPEARRLLVGLYCLTSTWAIVRRKTPLMAYNDYIQACAESLAAGDHAESDKAIVHRLEVVRFFTQAADTLGYSEPYTSHPMSDDRLEVFTGSLLHRLEMWKSAILNGEHEQKNKTMFDYHCMQAYIREVATYFPHRANALSLTRTRMLVDCLTHIKASLDLIMAFPPITLRNWTTTQWCALLYSVILANKVSTCHNSTSWNIGLARNVLKLEQYLSSLCQMLEESNRVCATGESPIYWFHHLIKRWELMKTSYLQTLEKFESSEGSSRGATPHTASSPASHATPHHLSNASTSGSPRPHLPMPERMEDPPRSGSLPTSYDRTPRVPVQAYSTNNYYVSHNQLPPPHSMTTDQDSQSQHPTSQSHHHQHPPPPPTPQQQPPQQQPPQQQDLPPPPVPQYNHNYAPHSQSHQSQHSRLGSSGQHSQQPPPAPPPQQQQQQMQQNMAYGNQLMPSQWLPPNGTMGGNMPGDYIAWEINNSFMDAL